MGRQIVTAQDIAARSQSGGGNTAAVGESPVGGEVPNPDSYTDRLLKYIPVEVVAVYLAVNGALGTLTDAGTRTFLIWVVFFLLLAGTPLYLARIQKVSKRVQLLIATVSFAVWVFSVGGPFSNLGWYQPVYGAIILPLFTFFVPVIEPES
jgi:hypothetical protein